MEDGALAIKTTFVSASVRVGTRATRLTLSSHCPTPGKQFVRARYIDLGTVDMVYGHSVRFRRGLSASCRALSGSNLSIWHYYLRI